MRATLFLFFVLFLQLRVYGQEILENNPPSLKWMQADTRNFRVIFPHGFEREATRVANTLERIRDAEAVSLGTVPRKIPVILQNQSSVSNGFVSVLPRRTEFYTMPSQDYNFTGTNDWLDLLAAHEYRHIVQYQHALRGFNKVFYYLFGATTFAGMAQVAAPEWFWEGDAVVAETAFTRSGRGRIPNFSLLFRTNLLEGRSFNYHKQYLQSYRHNIPDHYVLGYHMVSYLRRKTNDPLIWGKITARAWSVPFVPFTFSNAIRKEAGLHVTQLYREMAAELKSEWTLATQGLQYTEFTPLKVRRGRAYTDYLYPQALAGGEVLAMKKGIGNIEEFVLLTAKGERKVHVPGFINDSGMLSARDGLIVWNEFGYDPRWSVRNYSLIKAYDLNTGRGYVIGPRTARHAGAALSPDRTKLVTVRTGTDYKTEVLVISVPDGSVLRSFPNPDNHFYSMARWSEDGEKIVSLKTSREHGRSVVTLDPETGRETEIIPASGENIGHPVLSGNYLLFNSPSTGIDNIFALNIETGQRYQVTVSRYGAYNPSISPDGKTIYYNEQGRDGLEVVSIGFDTTRWTVHQHDLSPGDRLPELLRSQEQDVDLFDSSDTPPVITEFSKARSLLNPYSWGLFVDEDLADVNIGISSQDVLSTLRVEAGYAYNISERTGAFTGIVSYQGLFPIIDVSASIGERSVDESVDGQIYTFQWKETTTRAGLRIPLVTTSSRFRGSIAAGGAVGLTKVSSFSNSFDNGGRIVNGLFFREYADNGYLVYTDVTADAYRLLKRSHRDINSKWGQRLSLRYLSTPLGGDFEGGLFAATAVMYFPGLFRHHSLWGYGSFQSTSITRDESNYVFQSEIPLPRGHSIGRYQEFYSWSANYTMPVWYPDIALGPIVNIQRLRGNVFFDYGYGASPIADIGNQFTSVGAEAKIDINILRFHPQLDLGVRLTKGLQPSTTRFEVLVGTINF